jgi:type IV pilus assembly protein PilP
MKRSEAMQLLSYVGVSVLSVGAAFLISLQFIGSSSAQDDGAAAQEPPPPASMDSVPQQAPEPPPEPPPESAAQPTEPQVPPSQEEGAPATLPVPASPDSQVTTTTAPISGGPSSSLAEIESFMEPFIYDVVNRRDPFLPYAEYVPSPADGDGGPSRPMSPAQRFAIEELKLVGVMWDVKEPKALFQDPESEILTLGRDDSIGNRNGYIAAIREGEVVVVEAIRKRGDIIYRTKVIRIER